MVLCCVLIGAIVMNLKRQNHDHDQSVYDTVNETQRDEFQGHCDCQLELE